MKLLQFLAASSAVLSTSAFTTPIRQASIDLFRVNGNNAGSNLAFPTGTRGSLKVKMSNDNDEAASSTRKRRKRKDGKQFAPPTSTPVEPAEEVAEPITQSAEVEAVKPKEQPKENTVVMQVRDIRDVLSGNDTPTTTTTTTPASTATYVDDDDEELADDEEWEYYDEDEEDEQTNNIGVPGGRTNDDSLEQLLADARRMRASDNNGQISSTEEQETSIKDTIFDVISTIVTIDFFVVMALLVWFLAGIFCSTVLKDDAVQIAFNMNFEKVTQPALGILMIGSIAGSLGNKDEEE